MTPATYAISRRHALREPGNTSVRAAEQRFQRLGLPIWDGYVSTGYCLV